MEELADYVLLLEVAVVYSVYVERRDTVEDYSKKQYRMIQVIMGACIGVFLIVLVSAVILVPKAVNTMDMISEIQLELDQDSLNQLIKDVNELIVTLNQEVQELTGKLSEMDMKTLNEAIKNLSDAAEKMDFDELNRAITNLSDVVEPLAKFMNR